MLDDIAAAPSTPWSSGTSTGSTASREELEEFFEVCDAARLTALASVDRRHRPVDPRRPVPARVSSVPWPARRATTRAAASRRKHLELAQAGKRDRRRHPAVRLPRRPADHRAGRGRRDPRGCRAHPRGRQPPRRRDRLERARHRDRRRAASGPIQVLRRMLISARALAASASTTARSSRGATGSRSSRPTRRPRLRAILDDPARLTRRTVRRYLLAGGLLRCALCDAVLVARPRSDGTRRYVCAKGPGLAGLRPDRGPRRARSRSSSPRPCCTGSTRPSSRPPSRARPQPTPRPPPRGDSLAADRAQLEELARAYGERLITFPEYLAARKPIEARIEAGQAPRSAG